MGVEVATRSRMSHLSSRRPRIQDLHSSSTTHMAGSHRDGHTPSVGTSNEEGGLNLTKQKKKKPVQAKCGILSPPHELNFPRRDRGRLTSTGSYPEPGPRDQILDAT